MPAESAHPLLRFRLEQEGVTPSRTRVFRVAGDSMKPTFTDGNAIQVDYDREELCENRIYVLRAGANLVVKRAKLQDGVWWWHSDANDREPFQHCHWFIVWGQVLWAGMRFDDDGE